MNYQSRQSSTTLSSTDVWTTTIEVDEKQDIRVYFNGSYQSEFNANKEENMRIKEKINIAAEGTEVCVVVDGGWYEGSKEYRKIGDDMWFMFRENFTPWFDASCDTQVDYTYVAPQSSEYELVESIESIAGIYAPARQPIRKTDKLYLLGFQTHHSKKRAPKGSASIRRLSDIEGD